MQVAMNPQNTVFDAKRLIGRKFTDPSVQEDIKHWPFKVVDGPDHKPLIEGMQACQIPLVQSRLCTGSDRPHAHFPTFYDAACPMKLSVWL